MKIVIRRESDDVLNCPRASIGGTDEIGYYLVFRNYPGNVLKAIEKMQKHLKTKMSEVNSLGIGQEIIFYD